VRTGANFFETPKAFLLLELQEVLEVQGFSLLELTGHVAYTMLGMPFLEILGGSRDVRIVISTDKHSVLLCHRFL